MTVKEMKDFLSNLPENCDDMEVCFKFGFEDNLWGKASKIAPVKVVDLPNPYAYKKSSHPKSKIVFGIS